ncbi:MAG: putative rRNA maturation factor [Berkelbacteria bacterium GW2011_GWA1_39_10]|uniref:Putative rRNA maturation factor n=1 Tax=Berkelbacteria bacterium GW2011_GWA1_39_10 TaxID=1618332 RepID=A0A0G0PNH8_9BACT|nr:MAG: putative rRNA maturation factor [Berkelbacteria bacterium GW2011_GWA1_39_10]
MAEKFLKSPKKNYPIRMKISIIDSPSNLIKVLTLKTVENFVQKKLNNTDATVSIFFISQDKIGILNKKYRQIDKPTDVLSFPIWNDLSKMPKKGKYILGDIFICLDILQENSQEKKDIEPDLINAINHSLDHLVGKHH